MFKNQFSIIVYNRIILYLCSSTPKYFIYYFVYPNQWSLGDIFAKYSRMLSILAMLPWQLSGPTGCVSAWKTIACDCCVVCSLCVLVMHFQNFMTSYIILYQVSWFLIGLRRSRMRNAAVFDALVMQFSICMTKRATQPDHSLLSRSFQPE